ncbi:putative steryl acetyl hydrolase mug81 [Candida viswanathii]|uniref:Putative steryl acetyl hydrolase mug81 n=1 Tax=Candida viswanathii TaxID=5486 RepID=A0A367YGW6_9ASCO|nr:putative steryl acetyl hydrolase mug81 [Candida viswanathii]
MFSPLGLLQVLLIPIQAIIFAILYPFRGGVPGKYQHDFKRSLLLTLARAALKLSPQDKGALSFLSLDYILNKITPFMHPELTKLHNYGKKYDSQSYWVVEAPNRLKHDPILIYLHGGVYYFGVSPPQIEGILGIYHLLEPAKRDRLSILVLDYKLASKGHPMPAQLVDLVTTYKKLVSEGNDNIDLLGDSSGGNLAITFLQHLRIANEPVPYPRSVVLVSPWCKIVPDAADNSPGHSFFECDAFDIICWGNSEGFLIDPTPLMGNANPKSLTISPGNCPYSYADWEDIPTLNEQGYSTFVILGENETMRDDILRWCQFSLKSPIPLQLSDVSNEEKVFVKNDPGSAKKKVVVEPLGIHDGAMVVETDVVQVLDQNPKTTVDQLDKDKYFGMIEIVNFLNDVL